jgi:hypothetical protein
LNLFGFLKARLAPLARSADADGRGPEEQKSIVCMHQDLMSRKKRPGVQFNTGAPDSAGIRSARNFRRRPRA